MGGSLMVQLKVWSNFTSVRMYASYSQQTRLRLHTNASLFSEHDGPTRFAPVVAL